MQSQRTFSKSVKNGYEYRPIPPNITPGKFVQFTVTTLTYQMLILTDKTHVKLHADDGMAALGKCKIEEWRSSHGQTQGHEQDAGSNSTTLII